MNHSTTSRTDHGLSNVRGALGRREVHRGVPGRSPRAPLPSTPVTKRGVVNTTYSLSTSLHWLAAVTHHRDTMDCVAFITEYLGYGPEVRHTGLNGYTRTFEWVGGLKLMDNEKRPDMGVYLLANGGACEHYGLDQLAYIYQALYFTATRLDLAADGCRFTPSALRKLWLKDCVRTVCKPMKNAMGGRLTQRTHRFESSPTGDTLYMGSRSSTQYARCYNMRGHVRFEMELKRERAAQIMQRLCDGSPLSSTLGAAITQFLAFVDPTSDENRARCTVLPFWQRFIESLGNNCTVTRLDPRPERTVERLCNWIENQVAPSLAVYEIIKGSRDSFDDVRRNLRRIGLERARPRHHALVSLAGGWLNQVNPDLYRPVDQGGQTPPRLSTHAFWVDRHCSRSVFAHTAPTLERSRGSEHAFCELPRPARPARALLTSWRSEQ